MANFVFLAGEPGSGKTTAAFKIPSLNIEGLNPAETFIISVEKSSLPIRGWKKMYTPFVDGTGNYFFTDNVSVILDCLRYINAYMPHIKHVLVDDFQYLMSNEFFERAKEKGYDKFTDIGQKIYYLVKEVRTMRDDLIVFTTCHTESVTDPTTGQPKYKIKTLGKLLDDKYTIEGTTNYVLTATSKLIEEKGVPTMKKFFITQSDGTTTARSPHGVFSEFMIPNDLGYVARKIFSFENGIDDEDVVETPQNKNADPFAMTA